MTRSRDQLDAYVKNGELNLKKGNFNVALQPILDDLKRLQKIWDEDDLLEFSGDELYPTVSRNYPGAVLYCCRSTSNGLDHCDLAVKWAVLPNRNPLEATHTCEYHLSWMLETYPEGEHTVYKLSQDEIMGIYR